MELIGLFAPHLSPYVYALVHRIYVVCDRLEPLVNWHSQRGEAVRLVGLGVRGFCALLDIGFDPLQEGVVADAGVPLLSLGGLLSCIHVMD